MAARVLTTATGHEDPAPPCIRHVFIARDGSGAPGQRQPRGDAEARLLADLVLELARSDGFDTAQQRFNEDVLGNVVYAVQPDDPMEDLRRLAYSLLPGTMDVASSRWGYHVVLCVR
ncbi:MAG: hypothetical protein IT463_03375 [Planctomycetes bacterium]|nr:hypothetical protein [Planctomycetota bacterium]